MAVRITLTNKSQVTRRTASVGSDSGIMLDRAVYQYLGSLNNCKTLIADYNAGKIPPEVIDFLDRMNLLASGDMSDSSVVAIDEYLSKLGISEHYPYSKDSVNIPLWVNIESRVKERVLFDSSDGSVLTDGNEILVRII